jgi:hypothetical protein
MKGNLDLAKTFPHGTWEGGVGYNNLLEDYYDAQCHAYDVLKELRDTQAPPKKVDEATRKLFNKLDTMALDSLTNDRRYLEEHAKSSPLYNRDPEVVKETLRARAEKKAQERGAINEIEGNLEDHFPTRCWDKYSKPPQAGKK